MYCPSGSYYTKWFIIDPLGGATTCLLVKVENAHKQDWYTSF